MATGYDGRPGGRQSFASDGVAPVQTTEGVSGASSTAQVVGGEAIGGAVGGQYSQPGYVAAGLGAFFEKFMEPITKRKEEAQFFKGFTEAQSGRALGELTDNGSPLTKVFGPSGFQQGASYFHSRDTVNKWATAQYGDMDNLKRMAPDELSKHMATSSVGLMTGDPYADQMIQETVLEAQGPLIQTATKARYAWQQEEALGAWSGAANSSAGNLQTVAVEQGKLGDKADSEALKMSGGAFLRSMARPEGMTDEAYRKGMYSFLRRNMADGNFFGVNLLFKTGALALFDDEEARKLEGDYERYGKRALEKAMQDPEIMTQLLDIDVRVGQAKMYGDVPGAASVVDVVGGYQGINKTLKNRTGVDLDYFDSEKVAGKGGEVIDAIVSGYNQRYNRAEAIDDRNFNAAAAQEAKIAEAADKVSLARTAWGTGQVRAATAGGMPDSLFETIAMEDFSNGSYGGIANAYVQSGWKSSGVSEHLQAMARGSIGEKYTQSTEQSYNVWKSFNKLSPAMSKEYFGDYDLAFTNFDRMTQGGASKEVAYQDSFTRRAYSVQEIPADKRKEAGVALKTIIERDHSRWYNPMTYGNQPLNAAGRADLERTLSDDYARASQVSPRPPEDLAEDAYNQAIRSGRFEKYGKLGWTNATSTQTVGDWLGLKPKEADSVVTGAFTERLAAVGHNSLDDVRIIRTSVGLTAEYRTDTGPKYVTITYPQLQGYTDARVKAGLTRRPTRDTTRTDQMTSMPVY